MRCVSNNSSHGWVPASSRIGIRVHAVADLGRQLAAGAGEERSKAVIGFDTRREAGGHGNWGRYRDRDQEWELGRAADVPLRPEACSCGGQCATSRGWLLYVARRSTLRRWGQWGRMGPWVLGQLHLLLCVAPSVPVLPSSSWARPLGGKAAADSASTHRSLISAGLRNACRLALNGLANGGQVRGFWKKRQRGGVAAMPGAAKHSASARRSAATRTGSVGERELRTIPR